MPNHRSIPRFVPQASSPAEAYERATQIPRDIRELAEILISWSLSNLRNDATSATGNLPARFGFRCTPAITADAVTQEITLTPAAILRIGLGGIVCTHPQGATLVRVERFEPLHLRETPTVFPSSGAIPPAEPVQWLLAWATIARSFQLLGRYERWVMDTITPRMRVAQAGQRPKKAKQSVVPVLELPNALDAMAEWCGDGERAMMTWIIADARLRGEDPNIPRI
jgi:hypothetical protein